MKSTHEDPLLESLRDIEEGRVYEAKDAADLIRQCLADDEIFESVGRARNDKARGNDDTSRD